MKKTIIILHGWGLSGARYKDLQHILEQKNYSVFSPDLPGFGIEPLMKKSMTIVDYVNFIVDFMKKKKIKNAYFIGHSFGGRVIAKLAVTYPELIEKIIFTGTPLIKQKLSFKKRTIQIFVKRTRNIIHLFPENISQFLRRGIYKILGEWDYYKANEKKETFKNIISEDASVYIPNIKIPVLVLWGSRDTITPIAIGKKIAQLIPKAQFEEISQGSHSVIYTNPKIFAQKILSFLAK